jgi:2-hydroxycyclohexanecarboxyl-CoA dehydrogenase
MKLGLESKVVIVTGAAHGIGKAIALTFAAERANVVIGDIDLTAANIVAKEATVLGSQAVAIKADVSKADEVERMVGDTLQMFGRLDILVNNAGIVYLEGKPIVRKLFHESTIADWQGEVNLIFYGVLYSTSAALKPMLRQKSGAIINIVSDGARGGGGPGAPIYDGAKGGIISFSKNLAYELGRYGIRVNCVSPGLIRATRAEMIEAGREKSPEAVSFFEQMKAILQQVPLGRMGMPQDVANVVVFLASDASSYVTGQTLSVNGGWIMP